MDRPDQQSAAEIADVGAVLTACARFEVEQGRRPRILIATFSKQSDGAGAEGLTPGELDDGVARELAVGFAGMGFDADVGPAASTAQRVAAQAIDADVHAICLRLCSPDRRTAAQVVDPAQVFASVLDALVSFARSDIGLWSLEPADLADPQRVLDLLSRLADAR